MLELMRAADIPIPEYVPPRRSSSSAGYFAAMDSILFCGNDIYIYIHMIWYIYIYGIYIYDIYIDIIYVYMINIYIYICIYIYIILYI